MPVAGLKTVYDPASDTKGPHRNHPLFDEWAPVWRETRDALEGERAIKEYAAAYIERPAAFKDKEYAKFVWRAEYAEAPQRTHRGTLDRVFSKPTMRDIPARLTEMLDRLDGEGLVFDDVERWTFAEGCAQHRAGILADFDEVAREPRLQRYCAEKIFDWEFSDGGRLVRLVLDYPRKPEGYYAPDPLPARQVLVVDQATDLVWSVVYFKTRTSGQSDIPTPTGPYRAAIDGHVWVAQEPTQLLLNGAPVEEIPFVFVGGMNPQPALIGPLVRLARHYVNVSADFEHQRHNSAFAQWWIGQTVTANDPPDIAIGDGVDLYGAPLDAGVGLSLEMGSARVLMLKNARVEITEPSGGTLAAQKTRLDDLKASMVAYGARIFDQDVAANTAAQTVWYQNSANATSVAALARLVSRALVQALSFAALYANVDGAEAIKLELNTDYFDDQFTLTDIPQLVLGMDEGLFTKLDARQIMRRGGVDIRADEEIEKDLQKEGFEERDVVETTPENEKIDAQAQ